ncbi:FTR1 family protein [Haliea atlantica]|nr:iron permease [Haliea sp.]|tara:strand:- start:49628 stop:50422 length:795 start_codon:yes stop_codon:yes gene_type:complete
MLLDAVILVLREVLEAAFLLCVMLVFGQVLALRSRWVGLGLLLAAVGVALYAGGMQGITDALEGAGQEVLNAALQMTVFLLLMPVLALGVIAARRMRQCGRVLPGLMAAAVGLALVRESAEILIYVRAFSAVDEYRLGVYAGSALGLGIGASAGVLAWSALRALRPARAFPVCLGLLAVIGAGMVMQAALLLEQVDWLPAQPPLWDSSWLLSEQSLLGQLLFAVLGYEATPGPVQVALYVGSLGLAALSIWLGYRIGGRANDTL